MHHSGSPPLAWPAAALFAALVSGCATPPPSPALPPQPADAAAPAGSDAAVPLRPCARCLELRSEVAQLQRRLAERESELVELRARRHEQALALEAAGRQAQRAATRHRRLATRAAAASYIAEVEVSMAGVRSAPGAATEPLLLARAQQILDSSREPFVKGDYDTAIDRASQAAAMIARADTDAADPATVVRHVGGLPVVSSVPLRVRIDSNQRAGPGRSAAVRRILPAGTPVTADARRGGWLRVETVDGRSGWVYRPLLGPR